MSRHQNAHPRIARTGGDGGGTQNQAEQRNAGGALDALGRANDMPALDMAKLVREHALHLVGGPGGFDQPAVDVNILRSGDKGIDAAVADQMDADLAGLEPCCLLERGHHFAEQGLGLGVAQDRLGGGGADSEGKSREQQQGCAQQQPRPGGRTGPGEAGHAALFPRAV